MRVSWPFTGSNLRLSSLTGSLGGFGGLSSLLDRKSGSNSSSKTGSRLATPRSLFSRTESLPVKVTTDRDASPPSNGGTGDHEPKVTNEIKAERARGCDLTENISAFTQSQIEYHKNVSYDSLFLTIIMTHTTDDDS